MKILSTLASLGAVLALLSPVRAGEAKKLPNIVWITCEDMGPHLGCYGDKFAETPNLDRFAKNSLRYRAAWSNAPVCAPARTTIISGMYASATGSEHMRSIVRLPPSMKMFAAYLRLLGYYCINKVKEDYNLEKTGKVWDDSSARAHWKNRQPGQPFFAVINLTITHESQIRTRPHKLVHDPAKVPLPAYHPDTPEVRHDWTQYYDNITVMDRQVGEILKQLEADGLTGDTIIIFFSDHGSGMPRNKRCLYNCSLHVPMLLHVPERLRHLAPRDYAAGKESERLVSFVDLAPTMLSLAGQKPPAFMQGQAFLGPHAAAPRQYLFGFRGRMDERLDLGRSLRDHRYVYIRNYQPHKIQGQYLDYMFQTPTTRAWKKLFDAGKLNPAQAFFWKPRPPEELYDLESDPDEIHNLAGSRQHQDIVARFRKALTEHLLETRDLGFLPEHDMHERAAGATPYEMGRNDNKYPLKRILDVADMASMLREEDVVFLKKALKDDDSAVRYWAALGMLMRGHKAVAEAHGDLQNALADRAPTVRIVAAEALARFGGKEDVQKALDVLKKQVPVKDNGVFVSVQALNALLDLGPRAAPLLPVIRTADAGKEKLPERLQPYVSRLVLKLTADLR